MQSQHRSACKSDLICVWLDDVYRAALKAEGAELSLSYSTACKSENGRKNTGSYYTPTDVADYFWDIFFANRKIRSRQDTQYLIEKSIFVEPSVGAGSLFFALLKRLIAMGICPRELCKINADLIDINYRSLGFIRRQIKKLENLWKISFDEVKLINKDFRSYECNRSDREPIFFGNPPFVTNSGNGSKWKNMFADFVELSLDQTNYRECMHYILPLSIAFSRDYRDLRKVLRESQFNFYMASYDNIPDTLFKSGKQRNQNTNKANSQRCVIFTAIPSKKTKIYSSKLHRWSKSEREFILSECPKYQDITKYSLDDQFIRPASKHVVRYLCGSSWSEKISDIVSDNAKYSLHVSSVARNYVGFREQNDYSGNALGFSTEENFLFTLGLLSSDLFFEYWLTVGDGFHVTKSNIFNFPISENVSNLVTSDLCNIRLFWKSRRKFEKIKLNSGIETRSFDFSGVAPLLLGKF